MFELTDQAFARVQPLLPANSRRGQALAGPPPGARGILWKLNTVRRGAMPHTVRAVADLLQPAAPLAGRWDLAQDLGAAGRRRPAGLT
jgi:hypothetical protein